MPSSPTSAPITHGTPQLPSSPPPSVVAPQEAMPMATPMASTIVQLTTPLMGGLFLSLKDEYAAWTGGKPNCDLMGLDPSAPMSMHSPNRICPMYTISQVKGYNLQIEGLETKLAPKDSNFLDFTILVFDHLKNMGMDMISDRTDPLKPSNMVSVVKNFAHFSLEYIEAESTSLKSKLDDYDVQNNEVAVCFLLNLLHDDLCKLIQTHKENNDSFPVVWLWLMEIFMTSSFEQYNAIKERLKKHKPSDFFAKDIVLLSQAFQTNAQELEIGGKYDHDLTLKMLQIFLMAGGDGCEAEDYPHTLCNLQDQLSMGLTKVVFRDHGGA